MLRHAVSSEVQGTVEVRQFKLRSKFKFNPHPSLQPRRWRRRRRSPPRRPPGRTRPRWRGSPWRSCRGSRRPARNGRGTRRLANFRQNVARFRLCRHRFLQVNMRFAAFFKLYQILKLKFLKLIFDKFCKFCNICNFFAEISRKLLFFKPIFAKILRLERCRSVQIF